VRARKNGSDTALAKQEAMRLPVFPGVLLQVFQSANNHANRSNDKYNQGDLHGMPDFDPLPARAVGNSGLKMPFCPGKLQERRVAVSCGAVT
jgi:hypothetical protein